MDPTNIYRQIAFDRIPEKLREYDQWVLCKEDIQDGRATKVLQSVYHTAASPTDRNTWTSFDNAVNTYDPSQHCGIGFAFSSSDHIGCIKLVGCRDPETGVVADWAIKVVKRFASYTEVSPSQTGLTIWFISETPMPKQRKKELNVPEIVAETPSIQTFAQGNVCEITGWVYQQNIHIQPREEELQAFLKAHWPSVPEPDVSDDHWRSATAVLNRAREYVARIPGEVSGHSRDVQAFYVTCCLVKGFSLSKEQAFEVLGGWNAACVPQWTEPELRRKIDAAAKAAGRSGYLRNLKPELWDTFEMPKHQPPKGVQSFAGIDTAKLASYAKQEPDWLVQGIFTIDEPVLVGARSKGCKTLQLTDLAVAVASGTKWMGVFDVPKRRKVLFITGEANYRRLAKHIEKACKARGINLADLSGYLRVEAVEFPCLPSPKDQATINADVKEHGIEVVIVDPLYRGLAGVDSARLNETGSAVKAFQAACAPACMILSHHVVKSAAREYGEPPALEDMTGAGIAESCGQWWLVGRNEPYAWDWKHDLCVQFGGREGQCGSRRILFDEGDWTFQIEGWNDFKSEAEQERQRQRDSAKRDAEATKKNQNRVKVLSTCRNVKTPRARTRIRDESGVPSPAFGPVFAELVQEQTLVMRPYRDALNRFQPEGYLLAEYADEYDKQWNP